MSKVGILEGTLKQQCLDEKGLYSWIRKIYFLNKTKKILYIQNHNNEDPVPIPLAGAKYAKEWSFSSSLAGFGFDLVWNSGQIWSFLVDSESICNEWVESLNNTINNKYLESIDIENGEVNGIAVSKQDSHTMHNAHPAVKAAEIASAAATLTAAIDQVNSSLNETQVEVSSPTTSRPSMTDQRTTEKFRYGSTVKGRKEQSSPTRGIEAALMRASRESIQSEQFPVLSSARSSVSFGEIIGHPHGVEDSGDERPNFGSRSNSPPRPNNPEYRSPYASINSNKKDLPLSIVEDAKENSAAVSVKNALEKVRSELEQSQLPQTDVVDMLSDEMTELKNKCTRLEGVVQRKQEELNSWKSKAHGLEDSIDRITIDYEKQLEEARAKERKFVEDSKKEIDSKLLRMSNENANYYEATVHQLKAQHERELSCMKEQMEQERKKHASLFERGEALRDRAERSLESAQSQIKALQDKMLADELEMNRLKQSSDMERAAWERERKKLLEESQSTVEALQNESSRALKAAHDEKVSKITEINNKMDTSLAAMRLSERESARQELEGAHMRRIAELQKECQHEVERVRTNERRLAAAEIENIRSAFVAREQQTAEDLIELEKLHSLRVSQLEQQLSGAKSQNKQLQEKFAEVNTVARQSSSDQERINAELRNKIESQVIAASNITAELQSAHQALQECQLREASYREQLSEALTQLRVQHAELLEARQQAASGSAQAFEWRRASKESLTSVSAAEASMQIARDEVAMLEHALKRVEAENISLKEELRRADRIIYGVSQHEPVDKNTYSFSCDTENIQPAITGNIIRRSEKLPRTPKLLLNASVRADSMLEDSSLLNHSKSISTVKWQPHHTVSSKKKTRKNK